MKLRARVTNTSFAGEDRVTIHLSAPASFPENQKQIQGEAAIQLNQLSLDQAEPFKVGKFYEVNISEIKG